MKGILTSNDGSLYALVRSIVEKKKMTIEDFLGYTKMLDYAKVGDKYYTDRPPGLAFAAVPFYALRLNVVLVSAISGALSTVLVYIITNLLIKNPNISFTTALIFAFCTINWRYSVIFFIHSLSTMLVLLAVYGFLVDYPTLLIGIILGIATMVEYTDVMFMGGIALTQIILGDYLSVPYLVLGYVIGLIPLFVYNAICFGSPFTRSYKYSAHFKWSNSPFTTFVTPLYKGAFGLWFSIKNGGILTVSPILIFGIIGYFYLPYEIVILFLSLWVPLYLIISKHITWWGGDARDHRYMTAILPYLTIPIAFSIQLFRQLWPVMIVLAIISAFTVMIRISMFTVTMKDIRKIEPSLSIKEKGLLGLIKPRYLPQYLNLIFKGVFLRKYCPHTQRLIEKS
jgi:hypothetical protein